MKKILVSFIQDRSGSMATVWKETVNGFKKYVKDLQEDQGKDGEVEYLFSLTTFDTQIDTPYLGKSITSVDGDTLTNFGPRGSTALYDAVGKTLQAIDDNKSLTFDKAIVVIVTDGEENSSREWAKDALHAAIDERIKRGNWTFSYLGTQPETWDEASSLGMGAGASARYNAQNAGATYSVMSAATANMARSFDDQSVNFVSANTTPSMRAAVGLKTADDDPDTTTWGVQSSTMAATPPAATAPPASWVSHPVMPVGQKPPAKPKSNRKWK